jgi:ApeA N-terminal domain 1
MPSAPMTTSTSTVPPVGEHCCRTVGVRADRYELATELVDDAACDGVGPKGAVEVTAPEGPTRSEVGEPVERAQGSPMPVGHDRAGDRLPDAAEGRAHTDGVGRGDNRPRVFWSQIVNDHSVRALQGGAVALKLPLRKEEYEQFVQSWFNTHDRFQTPIALRIADLIAGVSFSEPRFLLAAQSLEALHRRLHADKLDEQALAAREAALAAVEPKHRTILKTLLAHAHEPTFRSRIRDLVARAEPEASAVVGERLREAVGLIVDARNGVTHWAPGIDEIAGLTLVTLRQVADAVFDLVLFKELGLSDTALRDAVQAHQSRNVDYWLDRALSEPE